MSEFFATFLPLLVFGYIITIGLGMIVGKERGAASVNRFWLRSIRQMVAGGLRLLARFLRWIASLL